MQTKSYSVLMIGLLAVGLLILDQVFPWEPPEAQAVGEPIIQFAAPAGTPRYMDPDAGDIDPQIVVDVRVDFPPGASACAGDPLPVIQSTLAVKVNQQIDGAVSASTDVNTSSWTWGNEGGVDYVTGQVTIGGAGSGQERSLYGIQVCISNEAANGCASKGIRVEHPVSEFAGGMFLSKATSFSQSAGCGLIDPGLIGIINNMLQDTVFGAIVPSEGEITDHTDDVVNFTQIPLLGDMNMTATLNEATNNVDLAPVTVTGVDLGDITGLPPGYNCEISGSGTGVLYGEVSPGADLDGEIRVYGITLETGSGHGDCTRDATGCELLIKFDGNPP